MAPFFRGYACGPEARHVWDYQPPEHGIETGVAEGSLSINGNPTSVAQSLYHLWLGASVMVKISRNTQPFETAMTTTRQILNLSA